MRTSATPDHRAGMVDVADEIAIFRRYNIKASGKELPYDLELEVSWDDDTDRISVDSLICRRKKNGEAVTTEGVRRIPVARIVRLGVESFLFSGKKSRKGSTYTLLNLPGDITSQGPSDKALRFTAAAYRLAYALGEPPTQGVAERLGLKRSTAGKWVMLARKRGFLGQTTERQAGA